MTIRERFTETLRFGAPDRVPLFDEGFRDEVFDRWREQGMPGDREVTDLFDFDRRERLPVNIEPIPRLDTFVHTPAGLDELRRRLDPLDPARLPDDWPARLDAWRTRTHVVDFYVSRGFFLSTGARDWASFEGLVYQMSDAPDLVKGAMDATAHAVARLVDRVLDDVDIDFAVFSEPIGGTEGPLLSPRQYREFALATYRPLIDLLRRRGVEILCFTTYSNTRDLLPAVVDAGFNCLWACETGTRKMDYIAVRREFGRDLRLIGGIDLDVLLLGPDAIRREMERVVPPLLEQGGVYPPRRRPRPPQHPLRELRLLSPLSCPTRRRMTPQALLRKCHGQVVASCRLRPAASVLAVPGRLRPAEAPRRCRLVYSPRCAVP